MSIRLMTVVWDIEFPTQSQKLIMLKLADYASDLGASVFPAMETLAEKAGCDERTAQRALKAFRDCGLIHLVRQGGNGPKDTNEWKLNIQLLGWLADGVVSLAGAGSVLEIEGDIPADKGDILSSIKGDTKGDIKGGNLSGRVTSDPGRVTPVSSKGGSGVTQSINNHQIEPSCATERASDEARAPSAPKVTTEFELTPDDLQWPHWITWLSDRDRRDLVLAAEEARRMVTPSRWPKDNSPFPRVDRSALIAKRKVGEGV